MKKIIFSFLNISIFSFGINNNYTSYLINRFGKTILDKIIIKNIDIFNIEEKIFTDLCSNFEIYGIDIPINTRIKEIYLGEEKEKVICTDDSCIFNNKSINNFTGICQCNINKNSIEYLLSENKSIKKEIKINASQIYESFKIFTCIEKGFNKNSLKNNIGFNISLFMLLIQIIFTIFFIIFDKNIAALNILPNPPKLIIYNDCNTETKHDNSIEIEQNNQSRDYNDSDYDEEIYIDDENLEKQKKNKFNESLIEIEEEKNNDKLRSEDNKKHNNFFRIENNKEIIDKDQNSQSTLRTITKLYKEKNESNKCNENSDDSNKYDNKRKIIIVKPTEQCLLTEENKITISQMKTMEDFMVKPKRKKRSIKNISLANKLVLNKNHFHSVHNYNNNINSHNNIINQFNEKKNDKNENNKLTLISNEIDNPIRIRDIILKNKLNKRDSLVSNKMLIMNESKEDQKENKIRPKSNILNRKVRKNKSKESYKDFINKKNNNDFKTLEHSAHNKSIIEKVKNNNNNILMNKQKFIKNINLALIDYFPLEEAKNKDFRPFICLYWNILSFRCSIINLFSCFKKSKIMSYTPLTIRIIKIIFLLMLNLFMNALILTQDYFKEKFYYFNRKYNIMNKYLENNISNREKVAYSMNHCFPRILVSFIICLIAHSFIEIIFFSERKKYYNFFVLKEFNNEIDIMIRKIKIKYYIFIFVNYVMMLIFFIYITNFTYVYINGYPDYICAGIWTVILLLIFTFVWSLIVALLRYYGLKNNNNSCYSLSQFLIF